MFWQMRFNARQRRPGFHKRSYCSRNALAGVQGGAAGGQTAPASTIPDAKKFLSPSPASLNSRGCQTQMKLWDALNLAADRQ